MQWILLLLLGIGFGVMSALPMGPVGVLIFRYTLSDRRRWALLCILGQTAAIFCYVTIVTVGLEGLLLDHPSVFHSIALVGAVLVSGLGVVTIRAAMRGSAMTAVQAPTGGKPEAVTIRRLVTTAFVLALTNPGVLFLMLTSVAVHGSVIGGALRGASLALYLFSVLLGIEGWFLLVVAFLPRLFRRPRVRQRLLHYLEWGAGSLLLAFGVLLFVKETHTLWTL